MHYAPDHPPPQPIKRNEKSESEERKKLVHYAPDQPPLSIKRKEKEKNKWEEKRVQYANDRQLNEINWN